ncbi:MAG: TonB family protein [Candidatus Latescibacterota bacterium]
MVALLYFLGLRLLEENHGPAKVRLVTYAELGPPPSLTNQAAAPQIQVSVPVAPPTVGIPEPVPDEEAAPEATISTQAEMSALSSLVPSEGTGDGAALQVEAPVEKPPEPPPVEEEVLPTPDQYVPVEETPVAVDRPAPEYPAMAIKAGIEGTVFVQILVDKTGAVRDVRILKGPKVLCDAALQAAWKSVWRPAIQNKRPVAVWVAYPVKFKLTD